jgi:non-heme chloroperoxidase
VVNTLDLRDTILVGFSMGTGEVTRYLGTYGAERVAKAALFGPLGPYLLQADDNPEGVPAKVFEDIKAAIREDRFAGPHNIGWTHAGELNPLFEAFLGR